MNQMIRTAALISLLALVYTEGAPAQVPELAATPPSDSVRAEILAFVESYYEALSERDWKRLESHFWPDATITTVWRPPGEEEPRVVVSTISEFIEQAPAGPGSREIFEERMLAARVDVRGPLGMVFARYTARFGDPGDISEWEGTDLFSLLRHGGEWRIVSLSFQPEG